MQRPEPHAPLPSHGKGRGALPSPRRGEGVASTLLSIRTDDPVRRSLAPSGRGREEPLGDGGVRGVGMQRPEPHAPLPSHGTSRGPLPSPRRGEGVASTLLSIRTDDLVHRSLAPPGRGREEPLGDGRERGVGMSRIEPHSPLPSHGKSRGPLPSPRRGEGPRTQYSARSENFVIVGSNFIRTLPVAPWRCLAMISSAKP